MARIEEDRVASLLTQGLEFYGTGDVARAFLAWNEVLELDPGNSEALDYMRDADRRSRPRGGDESGRVGSLVEEARRMLRTEGVEAAFEFLTSVPQVDGLESEAMIELLRANLFKQYRSQLGTTDQTPRVVEGRRDQLAGNLPLSTGFLLSRVDGKTPLSELVVASGMDRFEVLRAIHRMRAAGILEWGVA